MLKASSFGEKKLRAFEKIGFFQGERNVNKSIWIHAVSVGEVNVALKLIQELEKILESQAFRKNFLYFRGRIKVNIFKLLLQ